MPPVFGCGCGSGLTNVSAPVGCGCGAGSTAGAGLIGCGVAEVLIGSAGCAAALACALYVRFP